MSSFTVPCPPGLKALAPTSSSRYSLDGARYEASSWIVTDGRSMAIVPVESGPPDRGGITAPRDVLPLGKKTLPLTFEDGHATCGGKIGECPAQAFPDWRSVLKYESLPADPPPPTVGTTTVRISADQLAKLARAISSDGFVDLFIRTSPVREADPAETKTPAVRTAVIVCGDLGAGLTMPAALDDKQTGRHRDRWAILRRIAKVATNA